MMNEIENAIASLQDDVKTCNQTCCADVPFYQEKKRYYELAIAALREKSEPKLLMFKKTQETGSIEEDLELAKLMVSDLEKLWNSYAKKALQAKQERETKQAKKGFLDCETKEELIDLYGYGDIDEETYQRGLDYFDNPEKPKLSVIELHRKNIKELLGRWQGTVKELQEELNPQIPQTETVFEKMDRLDREERYKNLQ